MNDLSMTHEEVQKFLDEFSKASFAQGMDAADAICYGGFSSARDAGVNERWFKRLFKALPPHLIKAYNANLKLAEAEKLKGQAEKLLKEASKC